jgi:hypothetical protein
MRESSDALLAAHNFLKASCRTTWHQDASSACSSGWRNIAVEEMQPPNHQQKSQGVIGLFASSRLS